MIRLAILLFLLPIAQDPPKTTVKESGDFRLLVKELEIKFAGKIKFLGRFAAKDVSVSVENAGFYQALDALCRAHGEATYFVTNADDWSHNEFVTIRPATWVEYPSAYSGHFKVAVVALAREARTGAEGEAQRAKASLVLFAPPWMGLSWESGAKVEWTFSEAKDSAGRDVLDASSNDEDRYVLDLQNHSPGNFDSTSLRLRDFDVTRGLSVLSGTAKATVLESKVERIEAKVGATLECPKGRLKVTSVTEGKAEGDEEDASKEVRLVARFEPKAGLKVEDLDQVFESRVRFDSDWGEWGFLATKGLAFEITMTRSDRTPKWFEVKVRGSERTCDVPFRIENVSFKGK